jgi:HlyD family secretion protein
MTVVKARALKASVVVLAATLMVTACGRRPEGGRPGGSPDAASKPRAQSGPARAVRVVEVQSRALSGGLVVSGVLVSREEAAVGSELSGYRVAKVHFDQGAWVKQGQPLVELDDTLLQSQIAQQTALSAQADAQAKRVDGLDEAGVVSAEALETRRAQAVVQRAMLNDLKTRQSRMIIRAPVTGRILERNVRPGDIASAGGATPMFRMVRDGLVELNAEVAEEALWTIKPGDPVKVSLPSGVEVAGRVRLIDPLVDAQTKLGRVRVALPVREDLRPGGFARGAFTGAVTAARTVPETAIRYDADGASVMVVGADNRVIQRPVKAGRRADGYVELAEGPEVGAKVLLGAASFVLPGDRVSIVNGEIPTPAPTGSSPAPKGH